MQEHTEGALEDDTDLAIQKTSAPLMLSPQTPTHPSLIQANKSLNFPDTLQHKWIPLLNENVLPLIILSMQLQILRKKSYKCIH